MFLNKIDRQISQNDQHKFRKIFGFRVCIYNSCQDCISVSVLIQEKLMKQLQIMKESIMGYPPMRTKGSFSWFNHTR